MHLLLGDIWLGPTAAAGCQLLGAGDWLHNIFGRERALYQVPFLFQVLAACSPILTRVRMGKTQKELVKRYIFRMLKLATSFQVWGSFTIFWVDAQARVQGTQEQRTPAGAGSCEITEKRKEQLILSQDNNQPGCWHRDCCDPNVIIFLISQNPNFCCLRTVPQHLVCATPPRSSSCTGVDFFFFFFPKRSSNLGCSMLWGSCLDAPRDWTSNLWVIGAQQS